MSTIDFPKSYFEKDLSYKTISCKGGVSLELVMLWLVVQSEENIKDTIIDHTTFQSSADNHEYYMVSRIADSLGTEENVNLGLDKWEKFSKCLFNGNRETGYVLKVVDTGEYFYVSC